MHTKIRQKKPHFTRFTIRTSAFYPVVLNNTDNTDNADNVAFAFLPIPNQLYARSFAFLWVMHSS